MSTKTQNLPREMSPISRGELGIPFISNSKAYEYGAGSQNWAILQDKRGVMYFSNNMLCIGI